jgi:hypothetical protein
MMKVNYVHERLKFDRTFNPMVHSRIVGVANPLRILLVARLAPLYRFASLRDGSVFGLMPFGIVVEWGIQQVLFGTFFR